MTAEIKAENQEIKSTIRPTADFKALPERGRPDASSGAPPSSFDMPNISSTYQERFSALPQIRGHFNRRQILI